MKYIFISLVLAGGFYSASAQTDSVTTSTMPQRDSTPVVTTQNSMRSDSTGSMNNAANGTMNAMHSDSTGSMNNAANNMNSMRADSTGSMNNSTNGSMNNMQTDSTRSMNNSNNGTMNNATNGTMNNTTNGTMNTMSSDSSRSMNSTSPNMNSNMQNNMNSNSSTNSMNANSSSNAVNPGMVTNSQNIEGQKGYASLPISESYVPDDVIAKIKAKYPTVYDITPVKHTTDQMMYVVRVSDNGTFTTQMIGEDGNAVQ